MYLITYLMINKFLWGQEILICLQQLTCLSKPKDTQKKKEKKPVPDWQELFAKIKINKAVYKIHSMEISF